MAFRDYRGMLNVLKLTPINNKYVSAFIKSVGNQTWELSELQMNEIVRLYNIYCMPEKFEVIQAPKVKSKAK